jgi:hypothetical protein
MILKIVAWNNLFLNGAVYKIDHYQMRQRIPSKNRIKVTQHNIYTQYAHKNRCVDSLFMELCSKIKKNYKFYITLLLLSLNHNDP